MKNLSVLFIFVVQYFGIYQSLGDGIEVSRYHVVNKEVTCNPQSKYRSIDGKCNNLLHPLRGATNTRYSRLLKPRYGDGISSPPKSVTGGELPSARQISLIVFGDTNIQSKKFTNAFVEFGQFVAHDISNIQSAAKQRGCCRDNGQLESYPDKNCYHIPIPINDINHAGMKCMDFVRTLSDHDIACTKFEQAHPAEQINGATASLDLSPIYGSSLDRLKLLRSFKDGELKFELRYNMSWPQQSLPSHKTCFVKTHDEPCYFGGDDRINQNAGASIVHILFMREHNRIARELKKFNPKWTDERLFQEARRINIAQYQYIFYYMWIKTIAGSEIIKQGGLFYQESGGEYANDYNASMDLSIYNEFSGGVFRLPHTLIEGKLRKLSESHEIESIVRLSDTFNRPKFIEGYGNFESFLRGFIAQPSQATDNNYDEEVRSYLSKNNKVFGDDLKALDIQRGRDHGLGSYNDLREFCGLKRAQQWEDLLDLINQTHIDKLKQVYEHVDDVDLNVGTALENAFFVNGVLGYTYLCVLKFQIPRLRVSDRFWFENGDPIVRFTPEQLTEIRKASYSRIICDNGGNISKIPRNVFGLMDNENNILVDCSEIPSVNLALF